jgi:hypothetical protein
MSDEPIFILAPPRSFTSLICGMLGQHPELYGLPEVNIFAADCYNGLNQLYQRRRGFRHGLLRAVAELGLGEQSEENIQVAWQWLEEHGDINSAELFSDLAQWAKPRRLVDKSPVYVYALETLERIRSAYPNAFYIHLTRHPKSTCESMLKLRDSIAEGISKMKMLDKAKETMQKRYQKMAKFESPDQLWLGPHHRIIGFLEQIPSGRKIQFRGEAFMSDIDANLKRVAEWLGVSTSKAAIEAMKHPEHSPYACTGPRNAKFGNDPSYLESPALRAYEAKTVALDEPVIMNGERVYLSQESIELARRFGYE